MKKQNSEDLSHTAILAIIFFIAFRLDVSMGDMMGKGRNAEILEARQLALYFIHKSMPNVSLTTAGSFFGISHSTVRHAIDKISNMISIGDTSICEKYNNCKVPNIK